MKFLDPDTESAVRDFLARIPADIRLEQAILFGSRARGEHRPDSDADVALYENPTSKDDDKVSEPAVGVTVIERKSVKLEPISLEEIRRQARENWLQPAIAASGILVPHLRHIRSSPMMSE